MHSLARRFARRSASAMAALLVVPALALAGSTPAHAVTHIDAIFDCAAIEASNTALPKFWAEAGDTVTVVFRNCYTGSANSFSIFGGNANGMFLNQDSLTNATNSGLTQQWLVRNDATRTGDWILNGTIQATANGGSIALGTGGLTIGYYALPNLGGSAAWRLGGAGPTQTLTPLNQTISVTTNQLMTPSTAFTATNFAGSVTYSVSPTLPTGLSINSSTGVISGTPTTAQGETDYTIFVRGTSATMLATVSITVSAPTPSLSGGAEIVSATAGESITPTTAFTTTNFTCAPSFSVSPNLPDGLSLNSGTGVISGTPTSASASADYTVTASCGSESATATVSVGVSSPPPSITGGPESVTARIGETMTPTDAFSFEYFSCTPSFAVAPQLPAGLTINGTTGSISGTPTEAAESADYTVTASCNSETATAQFTLESRQANPIDDALSSMSSLVNTGLSTMGPMGFTAALLALGLPIVLIGARFRRIRELGTVVLYRSAHLTIVAPARFFDSLRGRSRD